MYRSKSSIPDFAPEAMVELDGVIKLASNDGLKIINNKKEIDYKFSFPEK